MNRRKFIGAMVAGSLLGGESACAEMSLPQQAATNSQALRPPLKPADPDPSIQQLAALYRSDLFRDFFPFMAKYVVDPTYGGFLCETNGRGVHITTNKYAWYEGRGIWVYSFLYNNLAREHRYLDVARGSVDFILRQSPTPPAETWPFEMTREGKPLGPPEPQVYGDLFIAEGLAEYSVATGERHYWQMAKDLLLRSVRMYDRADYYPEIGQTYLGPQARSFPGARIQGVWMVLVRVCTQMLRVREDPEVDAVAARCVDAVVNHHFNPHFKLNNELLNHDLTRPANEYAQLVYTGHCIEISWMLLEEALRLQDEALFNTLAERFRRHVEVAEDRVYGGVFRDLTNVNENRWTLDKVLWAQEEVTIGALLIFEHTGAPWAWDLFLKFDSYTRRKYQDPLKRLGVPLWIYGADRQVSLESYFKLPARVENYHHPRHLMLNLLRLNRMVRNKTKIPPPFHGRAAEEV
ncbi:MAG: AGE family epimerase/isomerase [Acidobacteriaceae bacterium]